MRVANEMLESIVFFYANAADANAGEMPVGTGFCLWIADEDKAMTHVYLVTNDHVYRASAPLHYVRGMNSESGKSLICPTSERDWYTHPNGDDIAVCYLGCDQPMQIANWLAAEHLLTRAQLEAQYVGLGDDCLMIGCFAPLPGKRVNRPALRFGNVSVMSIEPVWVADRKFDQDCFLVEMRSRGGFSGSPVYLLPHANGGAEANSNLKRAETLGICCGHLQEMRTLKLPDPRNEKGPWIPSEVEENSGMAMVIPAWKIHELLNTADLVAERREAEDAFRARLVRPHDLVARNSADSKRDPAI